MHTASERDEIYSLITLLRQKIFMLDEMRPSEIIQNITNTNIVFFHSCLNVDIFLYTYIKL